MKRLLGKAIVLITAACIALFAFAGCAPTRDDVIPKKLGTQEGLWLYYENTRMRTDGTERSDILETVEFEGEVYGKDEFVIDKLQYLTPIKTIVYALSLGESKKILYRYDYMNKTGGVLYVLEDDANVSMYLSDSYFFVKTQSSGILFDSSLRLVGTDFGEYTLDKDILYCYREQYSEESRRTEWLLEWYANGEFKSAWTDGGRDDWSHCLYYAGDFFYICNTDNTHVWYEECVDLRTCEVREFGEFACNAFVLDGEFYLTGIYVVGYNGGELYKVTGNEPEKIYDFGATYFIDRGSAPRIYYTDDEYAHFTVRTGNAVYSYYKMNRRTREIVKSSEIEEKDRQFYKTTVGDYTFYQSYQTYGFQIMESSDVCVYLYREKGGQKEAMQYITSEDYDTDKLKLSPYVRCFYHDICEF